MFSRLLKFAITVLAPLLVLIASIAGAAFLMATSPETERMPEEKTIPVVVTVPVEITGMQRLVQAYGTVMPAQAIDLSSELDGRVVDLHSNLQPGGIIREGELIVRLDPQEYEYALARARASLAEVSAALDVERGRQLVAQREWESFGQDMPESELGRELMLRKPQLEQAQARVASAQSEVNKAQLDLTRTEIRAPFDALVLSESVDLGQHVSPNDGIASLVGTDAFWIQASVPTSALGAVLDAARQGQPEVRVYSDVHTEAQPATAGRLVRHLGTVDPDGRMAQVLIEVVDPLAVDPANSNRIPLPLNTYVRVDIDAGLLSSVASIPRTALRENNELWVTDASMRLQIRHAEIVWRQGDQVAVRDVFEPGDQLIVSPLDEALPGMEVRLLEDRASLAGFE